MNKLSRLPNKQNTIIGTLEEMLELAQKGEIDCVVVAGYMPNGNVTIGYGACGIWDKYYLATHLQADANFTLVEENIHSLIERV